MIHNKFSFLPKIKIQLNGHEFIALLDSGSTVTYCKQSVSSACGQRTFRPYETTARVANGTEFKFLGKFTPELKIAEFVMNADIFVADDKHCPYDVLIGTDTLKKINELGYELKFNFATKTVNFGLSDVDMVNSLKVFENYTPNEATDNKNNYKISLVQDERLTARTDNV